MAQARVDLSRPVYLNQPLVVVFSEPVDPLSVSSDTFRVVDHEGRAVPGQQLEVHSQAVTVRMRSPVRPTLDDGSLAPGRAYRLEVVGYPELHCVRSRAGRVLTRSLVVPFRTQLVGGTDSPLLADDGGVAFALTRRPELSVSTGVLRLHFSRPPFPVSVQLGAFRVHRWVGPGAAHVGNKPESADQPAVVPIERVALTSGVDGPAGATVELQLAADPPLTAHDNLWVALVDGAASLVDYAGRPPVGDRLFQVQVQFDAARIVTKVMAADQPELEALDPAVVGFEVRDRAHLAPCARLAGGSGILGAIRPSTSVPFSPSTPTLDLTCLDVPLGVRLTLGGQAGPLLIRVAGSVRIAGELVLETPRTAVVEPETGAWIREDELAAVAGCVIVAAGDIEVSGRIQHVQERAPMGPSVALVAGGRLLLTGRTPPGLVYASEAELVGHAQGATPRRVRLARGWGGAASGVAMAYTSWQAVPAWAQGELLTQVVDPVGAIEVLVQLAPAHPLDPTRPDPQPDTWSQPRPASEPVVGAAGRFVRFLLRARLDAPPAVLPSLAGVALTTR